MKCRPMFSPTRLWVGINCVGIGVSDDGLLMWRATLCPRISPFRASPQNIEVCMYVVDHRVDCGVQNYTPPIAGPATPCVSREFLKYAPGWQSPIVSIADQMISEGASCHPREKRLYHEDERGPGFCPVAKHPLRYFNGLR
jgi:hypothetical protein